MKTQTFSPITVNMELKGAVDGILNNYGKAVVQLRQVVTSTTEYEPRVGNNRQRGLEGLAAKSGGATYNNTSVRTTLFAIEPGITAQQVQDELTKLADARLYQVISTDLVTTSGQDYAISIGQLSKETLAESQIVRDKDGNVVIRGGGFLFRQCFLDAEGREDEDESALAEAFVPAKYAHLLTPNVAIAGSSAAEAAYEANREEVVEENADFTL